MQLSFSRFDDEFLERSWHWLNDPEVKHLTMTPDFTREQQLLWFSGLPKANGYLIWGIECDGKPIGVVGLKNIDEASADYFGYIGERNYWGMGLGREIIAFAFEAARKRRLQKMRVKVRTDNSRAVHLYARTGFLVLGEADGVFQMAKDL